MGIFGKSTKKPDPEGTARSLDEADRAAAYAFKSTKKPNLEGLAGALDESNHVAADAFDAWLNKAAKHGIARDGPYNTHSAGLIKHFEALDGILSSFMAIYRDPEPAKDTTLSYHIPAVIARSAASAANRQAEITKTVAAAAAKTARTDADRLHAIHDGLIAARHAVHATAATAAARDAARAARDAASAIINVDGNYDGSAGGGNDPRWRLYFAAVGDVIDCADDALIQSRHALYRVEP